MNNNWEEQFDKEVDKFVRVYTSAPEEKKVEIISFFITGMKRFIAEREAEIRKETIEAVLPCKVKTTRGKESKYFKEYGFDRNNFATGHNHCRQQIIDSAKEKFNINLE